MTIERNERLESIQILRGPAAFSGMIVHCTYAKAKFTSKLPAIGNIFPYGGRGVQAIFVISGFVIHFT
jgi:peptidoglycan/LPS O-acetylase OafA/YrhL